MVVGVDVGIGVVVMVGVGIVVVVLDGVGVVLLSAWWFWLGLWLLWL